MAYVGTKTKSPTKVEAISDENTFIWEYLGWVMKSLKDHAKNIIKTAADIIRVFEMRLSGAGEIFSRSVRLIPQFLQNSAPSSFSFLHSGQIILINTPQFIFIVKSLLTEI